MSLDPADSKPYDVSEDIHHKLCNDSLLEKDTPGGILRHHPDTMQEPQVLLYHMTKEEQEKEYDCLANESRIINEVHTGITKSAYYATKDAYMFGVGSFVVFAYRTTDGHVLYNTQWARLHLFSTNVVGREETADYYGKGNEYFCPFGRAFGNDVLNPPADRAKDEDEFPVTDDNMDREDVKFFKSKIYTPNATLLECAVRFVKHCHKFTRNPIDPADKDCVYTKMWFPFKVFRELDSREHMIETLWRYTVGEHDNDKKSKVALFLFDAIEEPNEPCEVLSWPPEDISFRAICEEYIEDLLKKAEIN